MLWKTVLSVLFGFGIVSAQNDFDWTALQIRVAGLLQQGNVTESQRILQDSVTAARRRGESSAEVAGALNELGTLYHDAGHWIEAERAYTESLSHLTRLPGTQVRIGVLLGNLAGLRLLQGKPSEAEKVYLDAERILASSNATPKSE